jgi:hypothetical protein
MMPRRKLSLLPHAHDYDMKFPNNLNWRFECKCGHVVHTPDAAMREMYWTQLARRIGLVLWGLGIACAGLIIVMLAVGK